MEIKYIEYQKYFTFSYMFLFSPLLKGQEDKGAKKCKKTQKRNNYLKKENTMKWYILRGFLHFWQNFSFFMQKTKHVNNIY